MFPLICSEELKRIGTKLESTTQIWNQPILQRWFPHLPARHEEMVKGRLHTVLYLYLFTLNFLPLTSNLKTL